MMLYTIFIIILILSKIQLCCYIQGGSAASILIFVKRLFLFKMLNAVIKYLVCVIVHIFRLLKSLNTVCFRLLILHKVLIVVLADLEPHRLGNFSTIIVYIAPIGILE